MNINSDQYNTLTLSEKIFYGKLESLGMKILLMKLDDVAEYSKVSTATINRTLKKIGYKNLKEYKLFISSIHDADNADTFENQLIELIKHNNIDISEDLINHNKIFIVGFGITSSLANEFVLHLRNLNIRCEAITDSDMLNFLQINDINSSLIIYLSYSASDVDMQKASVDNKNKIKQILITCTPNSLLSLSCDKVLCTNTANYDGLLNSRIPMYIIVMKQIATLYKIK